MVQTSSPVDGNISIIIVELNNSSNGTTSGGLTESEEFVKERTILSKIKALQMARECVLADGLRGDGSEKIHVVVGVEKVKVNGPRKERTVYLHASMDAVVDYEIVSHTDSVRLHRMTLAVVVVPDRWLVRSH